MASLRARLERLESLRETFGAPAAREKLELLAELEHKSLGRAADVERLHEALCFSRAWPDNPKLLTTVNRMLKNFSARADLRRKISAIWLSSSQCTCVGVNVDAKFMSASMGSVPHLRNHHCM